MKTGQISESLIIELELIHIGDMIRVETREMNAIIKIIDLLNYRTTMKITEYVSYWNVVSRHYDDYELCPKCSTPLVYSYQPYCGTCGQQLKWISKRKMLHKNTNC